MADEESERLDAIEAWMIGVQARMDGLKAEMRMGGGKRRLREQLAVLRAELDAQTRALEEILGESPDE